MAHRLTFSGGLHGWAEPAPPHVEAFHATFAEPVAGSFLAAAAAWAFVTLEFLLLRTDGWLPAGVFGGRFAAAMAVCAATAAVSLLAAGLYQLPSGIGGRLRFPGLAWAHLAVVNLCPVMTLWILADRPWLASLAEDHLVGALTGFHGLGIAALVANLVASLESEPPRE